MSLFSRKKDDDGPRRRQSAPSEHRATESELEQRYAFKRNRTLTGSSSSQVTSTGELNAQLQSPRVQAHHLARQRRHIGALLVLVIMGCVLLFGLISQFTAGVAVKTSDNSASLDETYEKAIQAYLSEHPAERLRFLLDTGKLNEYLQTTTPEIKAVKSVSSSGFGSSLFTLTMRMPLAGWNINGKQQYVDESGVAFARNYYRSPAVQIVDNSGIQVAAGQAVASNGFLSFVGQVVGLAKARNLTVTQVVIPVGTTRQIELRLKDISYPIKFQVDRAVGEQVEDMANALGWIQQKGITPSYLDVRVSGRAFYR